jgi:thymidylate synthase
MMIAQQCDLQLGEFVWTGGDVHLYLNHQEQAKVQLARTPHALPTMKIKRKPSSIFDYHYDDFELIGYDADTHIFAPIAI